MEASSLLYFYVYLITVLPRLDIQVNGINVSSEVYIPANEPSLFSCYSYGSRPESNLFWLRNGVRINSSHVDNVTICKSAADDGTLQAFSSIMITTSNLSGAITCVSELTNGISKQTEKQLKFYTYGMCNRNDCKPFTQGSVTRERVPLFLELIFLP